MSTKDNHATIEFRPTWGKGFTCQLSASNGDGVPVVAETVDVGDSAARDTFAAKLTEKLPGIDAAEVGEQLRDLFVERQNALDDDDGNKKKRSQMDTLVGLVASAKVGHDGQDRAFIRGEDGRAMRVRDRVFADYLLRLMWATEGKAPNAEALTMAVNTIAAGAICDGPLIPAAVRLAGHEGRVYLDLADESGRVVEIDADGWRLIDGSACPIWFYRPKGVLPLPAPVAGGAVNELRQFLHLPDDSDFVLAVAWLLAVLSPDGPYPVLNISGEQGSGKSTAQRMLRSLVDPNIAPLRSAPREERDLAIAAQNSRVVAYDNLSRIPEWLSNALCRLATGDGFGVRKHYSDDEETLFEAKRPVLLNGITDVADRADLLDRCIGITLSALPARERLAEKELWARFEAARPSILGALLDAVAVGLRNRDAVSIPAHLQPRMLDFALWAVACEPALPWKAGAFLDAFTCNRQQVHDQALEASIIGPLVVRMMDGRDSWQGTAADLLADLEHVADDRTRNRRDWPESPRKVSNALSRCAPNLRAVGLDVARDRVKTGRLIFITRIAGGPGDEGDEAVTIGDEAPPAISHPLTHATPTGYDSGDEGDDSLRVLSESPVESAGPVVEAPPPVESDATAITRMVRESRAGRKPAEPAAQAQ